MNINKEALLADLESIKAERGKLYQNDYRDAIDRAPAVAESAAGWVSVKERLPEGRTTTLVTVERPFGAGRVLMAATYNPIGFYNGGANKWDCEPVIGVHAGCKVVAWLPVPDLYLD